MVPSMIIRKGNVNYLQVHEKDGKVLNKVNGMSCEKYAVLFPKRAFFTCEK